MKFAAPTMRLILSVLAISFYLAVTVNGRGIRLPTANGYIQQWSEAAAKVQGNRCPAIGGRGMYCHPIFECDSDARCFEGEKCCQCSDGKTPGSFCTTPVEAEVQNMVCPGMGHHPIMWCDAIECLSDMDCYKGEKCCKCNNPTIKKFSSTGKFCTAPVFGVNAAGFNGYVQQTDGPGGGPVARTFKRVINNQQRGNIQQGKFGRK